MNERFFETFNANHLSAIEVAKNFIPPIDVFNELCGKSHSLVIGPRGSGKTTLLKMLQPLALASWNAPQAHEIFEKIDFIGIFVPSDIVWSAQFKTLHTSGVDKIYSSRLVNATFATHTFMSLVNAIEDISSEAIIRNKRLSKLTILLSPENKLLLVDIMASTWKLAPKLRSMLGIKIALRERLSDIGRLVAKSKHNSPQTDFGTATDEWLDLQLYESSLTIIETINGLSDRKDQVWAFLFDELELAPEPVRQMLLELLRGIDGRILLKLSMSPYNRDFVLFSRELGAKFGNDYKAINLTYSERGQRHRFCSDLVASMLQSTGTEGPVMQRVFGPSYSDEDNQDTVAKGGRYGINSKNFVRLKSLAEKDPSFAEYLERAQIDLKKIQQMKDASRASAIRKLSAVVLVRDTFLQSQTKTLENKNRLRSRRRPEIYIGASGLSTLTEGNPRWIIATLSPLVLKYARDKVQVSQADQVSAIQGAIGRFRALLSTAAISSETGTTQAQSVLSMLDAIGQYFQDALLGGKFNPEPTTSFIVDNDTPFPLISALQVAILTGAVVHVPRMPSDLTLDTIEGERFRVTHLLAPHYKLPLTIGRARSLGLILKKFKVSDGTLDLFEDA